MANRRPTKKSVEKDVLLASRRRCCLCVFLDDRDGRRRGQIAHLNHDPGDSRFENLVFLCLEHHDEYDSRTRQSKAFLTTEVREYRNRLYAKNPDFKPIVQNAVEVWRSEPSPEGETTQYTIVRDRNPEAYEFTLEPWRFPLWQVANQPEFFAYKAGNRADGVCLVERIDIPDGRIIIACIQVPGNPGNSITNCVEELCFQVCERFDFSADRLVWLEHYDKDVDDEWRIVKFAQRPPNGRFEGPSWTVMTPSIWQKLRLRPKKTLRVSFLGYESKVRKLFKWPDENLF